MTNSITPYRENVYLEHKRKQVRWWWVKIIFRIIRLVTLTRKNFKPIVQFNNDVFAIYYKKNWYYQHLNVKNTLSIHGWYSDSGHIPESMFNTLTHMALAYNRKKKFQMKQQ